MDDQAIEQEILAKGLTAPRITLNQIDVLVDSLTYKTHVFEGTTTTIAGAFLPNGFSVSIGQSACASPENFNAEIGARIAMANARQLAREELWKLEGYVLKQKLSAA